jgi:hypothetical protein
MCAGALITASGTADTTQESRAEGTTILTVKELTQHSSTSPGVRSIPHLAATGKFLIVDHGHVVGNATRAVRDRRCKLRPLRCSTTRFTSLVQTVLALRLASSN